MPSEQTPWVVKGVPEYIRRKVKIYAVQRGITMAQAVEQIVNASVPGGEQEVYGNPAGNPSFPIFGGVDNVGSTADQGPEKLAVDIGTWLKAWANGTPIPWIWPEGYEANKPKHEITHGFAQGVLQNLTIQPWEIIMMWIAHHLDECEECSAFARKLVE